MRLRAKLIPVPLAQVIGAYIGIIGALKLYLDFLNIPLLP